MSLNCSSITDEDVLNCLPEEVVTVRVLLFLRITACNVCDISGPSINMANIETYLCC